MALGRTLWFGPNGRAWADGMSGRAPERSFVVDTSQSEPTGLFDTLCVEWHAGMDLEKEVRSLTDSRLRKGGQIIVLGVPQVVEVLEGWPETGVQPTLAQPYGLLSDNLVLRELLRDDGAVVLSEIGEAIGDEKTMNFWLWFEAMVGTFLPPALSSRSVLVFGSQHCLGEAIGRWENISSVPLIDGAAISWVLGSKFSDFRRVLNTWLEQPRGVAMGPRHLVAILSESIEWRVATRVDYLSLFNQPVRDDVLSYVAWRLAYVAHRTLPKDEFRIGNTALLPLIDFMLYPKFSDVLIEYCRDYP